MPRKSKLIPFSALPGSWGLRGRTRSRAEAEYYFEGEELERQLADIDAENEADRQRRHLAIDFQHGHLDDYTYRHKLVEIEHPEGRDRDLALLAIDYDFNKISKTDYEKQAATIRGEPYVGVMSSEFDPKLNVNGMYFELDWNEAFIEMLHEAGYTGLTQEQVVNRWFDDLCRSIAENVEDESEPPPGPIQQIKRNDGRTEYS